MPTVAELTEAAPKVPVLELYAYSQVMVNRAGLAHLSLPAVRVSTDAGAYELADDGLIVRGNSAVYATFSELPGLASVDDRVNSTQHFFRELNRFGLTSIVDAGASGIAYPDDYQVVADLAAWREFPVRIASFLFAPNPGTELKIMGAMDSGRAAVPQPRRSPAGRVCPGRRRRSAGLVRA